MQRLAATIKKAQGQSSFEEGQVVFRSAASASTNRRKKKTSQGVHNLLSQPLHPHAAANGRGGRWRAPAVSSERARRGT
eukprot:3769891-Rhodomonas_salina.1